MDAGTSERYAKLPMTTIITFIPGWLLAVIFFGLLWLASWLGVRLRRRLRIKSETPYATSAAVSLLALLIGFTMLISYARIIELVGFVFLCAGTVLDWHNGRGRAEVGV